MAAGFATPPTLSRALADACREHTVTVVLHHDCVPRFSLAHLRGLREELRGVDWYSDMRRSVLESEYMQVSQCGEGGLRKKHEYVPV